MEDAITIDEAGRVVIPKRIRELLGLKGGSRLRVVEQGGRVVLEPLDASYQLVEKDGLLVVRGLPGGAIPDVHEVYEERTQRELAHLKPKRK